MLLHCFPYRGQQTEGQSALYDKPCRHALQRKSADTAFSFQVGPILTLKKIATICVMNCNTSAMPYDSNRTNLFFTVT